MKRKKPSKKQNQYTLMVLKILKEVSKTQNARLSIREMSRILNINHMAVYRAVGKLEPILDIKKGSNFENFRLRVSLIRLKNEFGYLDTEELMKKVNLYNRLDKEIFKR